MSYEDAEAARELILELVNSSPKSLLSKEIGEALGLGAGTTGQLLIKLTENNKIQKIGKHPGHYTYARIGLGPVVEPSKEVVVPPTQSNRYIITYKIEDKWRADVLLNEKAAETRATDVARLNKTIVFIGKATSRVLPPTEPVIEKLP
jgi:hypothetical protein